ncbi:hypothetical protein [Rhodococcus sp. C3V]|uniref:hypothetical protein n=1 Tax=Rhodococcus sp. C3V TaxID=3034165 RepID=UPI0023E0E819|nr:hypothetical protein [Rhodococcus sp. C3V]MDF3316411.1 hypothetical protein [Rhodococcus sp. C3V]
MTTPNQLARAILLFLFVVLWGIATWITCIGEWNWRRFIAIVAIGIFLYFLYYVISFKVYSNSAISYGSKPSIDAAVAITRTQELSFGIPNSERIFYIQALLSPRFVIRRIGQSISLTSRSQILKTAYLLEVPGLFSGKSVAIPITLGMKGRLLDNFQAHDENGNRISPLSQENIVAHTVLSIRSLISDPVALHKYINQENAAGESLEMRVAQLLCSHGHSVQQLGSIRQDLLDIDGIGTNQAELVLRVLDLTAGRYPIVFVTEVPERLTQTRHFGGNITIRFTVEQRSIPLLKVNRSLGDRARDIVRLPLGIRPTIVSYDLIESSRCDSYHFELLGPEGTYLARQGIVDSLSEDKDPLVDVPHRFLARHGQRYGHVYINKRPLNDSKALTYIAHFYERSPGSIAPATISALAAAILISVAAAIRLSPGLNVQADVVAVLLALPSIAGGWVGFDSARGLFGGSLNSRLSLMTTMMLSIVAAAYFMLSKSDSSAIVSPEWVDRDGSTIWILLTSGAIINFVLSGFSWLLRANVHGRFVNRSEKAG